MLANKLMSHSICLFVMILMFSNHQGTDSTKPSTANQGQQVYIPKDLDDCFVQLEKILKPDDIKTMRGGTEKDMAKYHFGLGMWMRNNWGFWRGSRLAKWFNGLGIKHPDDMSGIILDSFWRHLNGNDIKLEDQIKYYQEYWERQKNAPDGKSPAR